MTPASRRSRGVRSKEAETLISRLACSQGRRDESRNIELGRKIAREGDKKAVAVLVDLLADKDAASNATKALYECGYVNPALLAPHVDALVEQLQNRKNRLVWGAMISLSCVAGVAPDAVWRHKDKVTAAFDVGSVITKDAAIATLAFLAGSLPSRSRSLVPWFHDALKSCRAKDLPRWAERVLPVLGPASRKRMTAVLSARAKELTPTGSRRRLERLLQRHTP